MVPSTNLVVNVAKKKAVAHKVGNKPDNFSTSFSRRINSVHTNDQNKIDGLMIRD